MAANLKPEVRVGVLASLLMLTSAGVTLPAQNVAQDQVFDRQFHSAVAAYDAGNFTEAATQLESLLPHLPRSFEIRELLGLAYASQELNAKAVEQLEQAVRLQPQSPVARINLAASLAHSGQSERAEKEFEKALALDPRNFAANHDLGEFYVQGGRIAQATPLLAAAQRIDPSSYGNGYDLAQAYFLTEHLIDARRTVKQLIQQKNTGELHNLLGQIEEKDGNFVAAANEFETAAHMDPSEENLFAWGSEYLLHRTYDPAITVFEQATRRYPDSSRLAIGLGMSLYWRGRFDEAVKALLTAVDLAPSDPRCYLFLSKAYDNFPAQGQEVAARFRRYAELEPSNARAQYYYAMSLWKGNAGHDAGPYLQTVESLLKRSIALDDGFAEAHFQLGNLCSDHHEFARSYSEYERALALDPGLADAHYRLGQQYVRDGRKDRAQQEFALYQQLRAARQAELDKQAAETQQFVYQAKAAPAAKP